MFHPAALSRANHIPDELDRNRKRIGGAGFVNRNLGGSVAPFVAYLSDSARLTDAEVKELEAVVARLQSARRKAAP